MRPFLPPLTIHQRHCILRHLFDREGLRRALTDASIVECQALKLAGKSFGLTVPPLSNRANTPHHCSTGSTRLPYDSW